MKRIALIFFILGIMVELIIFPWNCDGSFFFNEVHEIRQTIRLKNNLFIVIEGIGSGGTTPDSRVIHLSNNSKDISPDSEIAILTGIDPNANFYANIVSNTVKIQCPMSRYYTEKRKAIVIDGIPYSAKIFHMKFKE